MSDVNIAGYDNEDVVIPFAVTTGDQNSPTAFDLTGFDLESDIVNAKTGGTMLALASAGASPLIVITDAAGGLFQITIPHGSISGTVKASLKYDVLAKNISTGAYTRLFGGSVQILSGSTTPE